MGDHPPFVMYPINANEIRILIDFPGDKPPKINEELKKKWQNSYIDLIEMVIDTRGTVPIFTPNCKFISQDCRHFTEAGAKYFARLVEAQSDFILNGI